ncbi:MAG: response regulator transcription factor [Tannerella sp.]|jgi:DNA-binding response OmpR family regulator|nr:response regulator transcription factor [Tannerella sp.]
MIKVLLVEDDPNMSYIIRSGLEDIIGGYEVVAAENGAGGLELLASEMPDIIVSDIEMPGMDGYSMVRAIRLKDEKIPVIFATARVKPSDVSSGYDSGADMYIKKPFTPEELDGHIRSLLRLKGEIAAGTKTHTYIIGSYTFQYEHYTLTGGTEPRILTAREAEILKMLCERKGDVVSREAILNRIWDHADFYTSRSLDVFISKLRDYLKDDKSVTIKVMKGVGIILND